MYNVLRMGKKVFTVSVVVATVAWSIGLAALLLPLAASAATLQSGDLIKASLPAVYYYGADGKRYVFPNKQTYDTWYSDFSGVKTISDSELAALAIGGNVTYRPGVKMVKIQTDPKVYAVDKKGTLRWVNSEATAKSLYGDPWNTMIDDVSDAFFTNYTIGADVTGIGNFDKVSVMAASPNINVDKNLSGVAGGGGLSVAVDMSNPMSASMVVDSDTTEEDSGQQRVPVLSLKLSASSGAGVNVSGLTFNRGGISKDGDVDNLYLMEGDDVLAEATSVNDGVGTFTNLGLAVAAGASRTVNLVMNLNKATASGSTMNWSLSASKVVSDASSVSGSATGNSMTVVAVSDLGQLEVGATNTAPSSVDPGSDGKELWRLSFAAAGQDMLLTFVKMTNLGTADDADLQNLHLWDGATQLNGVVTKAANKEVTFDLSGMALGGHTIKAGQSKQLTLVGDVVGGTNRNYKWTIQKGYDVRAKDLQYNVWAFVDDYDATDDDSFGVINQAGGGKADTATDIKNGSLSVTVATDSPATNVADEASSVTLAKFNFKATGEDVKVTDLTVVCTASTTTRVLKNTKVMLDGVQVGSTDSSAACAGSTSVATYTFGNSFIAKLGVTHTVSIVADLNASTSGEDWAAGDTLWVGLGGTGAAQGKTSLTSVTVSNQNGRTLTVNTGTLTVIKDLSFGDRSSTFPTGVSNAQGVKIASFVVVGGAGEAVDVNQFVLRDYQSNYFLGDNFQNLVLKDRDGNQVGSTISSLNTTIGTYTFTPGTAIRLAAGEQKPFDVYADVKGSVTDSAAAINGVEVDTVSATGVQTGASANFGTAGDDATDVALQNVYIAIEGNLTVEAAADTPVAQQLVLGSTGVSLAKFKLTADSSESLTITEFTVADDMSTGNTSRKPATGTLKNLKLYHGSTLLASVSALDQTYNTQTPIATFTGFNLSVPSNQNLTLEVKADLTSFNDGGQTSSTHRLFVPVDTKSSTSAVENPVVVVGAGSGLTISGTSLDLNDTTDANVNGSYMDMVRAKLTLAHASDSPSGSASSGSEQTVAKFVASNSSNVGNYSVYIRNMNFDVNHTGASLTQQSNIKVYKDSISSSNQLISSGFCSGNECGGNFVDTSFAESGFTDLEISAGSSRTIVVTLDTSGASMAANDTLSVGLLSGANGANLAPVQWDDGQTTDDYYTVNSLPLAAKTLVY